jgi:hypothetical protein
MAYLRYGISLGIWDSAAVVEIRERRGVSASWLHRMLMGVRALLVFVAYVVSE